MTAWQIAVAAYAGALIGAVAAWSRMPRPRPPEPPEPVQPEWSQTAIDAEFARMLPGLVTAEVFALDAEINRNAGWAK